MRRDTNNDREALLLARGLGDLSGLEEDDAAVQNRARLHSETK